MRKLKVFLVLLFLVNLIPGALSQEAESEKILVIREGKQYKNTTVALEGFLLEDVLEVRVETRMYNERPHLGGVYLIGPKIGKVRYSTKEEIPLSIEEEDPYAITRLEGLIATKERTKTKKPKGTLTKELFQIKVPVEKIEKDRKYQILVKVESKNRSGSRPRKFKFDLEEFGEIVLTEADRSKSGEE